MSISKNFLKHVLMLLSGLSLIILTIAYIFPFIHMIGTSLKSFFEASLYPPQIIPSTLHFENYTEAFKAMHFWHFFKNSLIVTVLTIVGQVFVCIPAAYVFAKKEFRFKKSIFAFILFDLMIPVQVVFLPIYVIISRLGWLNSYAALVVPFTYSAFTIFFLTQSFKTIPNELLDAAKIDKSSEFQIISKILIPSSKSVIITVALFTFISKWNDYFWVKVLTTNDDVRTLPMAVQSLFAEDRITEWNVVMAGNVLLFAPMFLIYLFANKSIKQAFVYGGIK